MAINFNALKEEMPFKWKVQTANEYNCTCVAYVDSRQVQDKLDEVVGPANWQDRYDVIDGDLHCQIGIWDEDKREWVWKGDCGTESMTEKEKGQASDAFKRAAVKWGVGRFLYTKEIQKLKSGKDNRGKNAPFDDNGKQIWDVTKHINDKLNKGYTAKPATTETVSSAPVTSTDSHTPTEGRYSKTKGGANVEYTKTTPLSSETMERVRGLNRDGKTGGEVLKSYLSKYNEANNTKLAAADLKTDEIVLSVINFIDNSAPSNL